MTVKREHDADLKKKKVVLEFTRSLKLPLLNEVTTV